MPTVTAIIPTYGRPDLTHAALLNLSRQTRPPEQILVVDDGSQEPYLNTTSITTSEVIVLRHDQNRGFAPSINTGIHAAAGEFLFILNNDVTLNSDWLETILAALSEPAVSFATGKNFRPDGLLDGTWDLLSKGGLAWKAGHGRPDGSDWSRSRNISLTSFTSVVIKRHAMETAGPLDEDYVFYYEDVEWSLRAALLGLSGTFVPQAQAVHLGSQSAGLRSNYSTRQLLRNHRRLAHQYLLPHYQNHFRIAWSLHRAMALSHGHWPKVPQQEITPKLPSANLHEILDRSEQELYDLQQSTGMDNLWRLYFRFTGRKS